MAVLIATLAGTNILVELTATGTPPTGTTSTGAASAGPRGRSATGPAPSQPGRSAPTTAPGSVITVTGGPAATANIPGPHSDAADFYGIIVALIAILGAIALTRVVFGSRTGSRRSSAASESNQSPPRSASPPTGPTGEAGAKRSPS